jgi:hypothetical protein
MFERMKLEKDEGKSYNEAGVRWPLLSLLFAREADMPPGIRQHEGAQPSVWHAPWYQFARKSRSCSGFRYVHAGSSIATR